MNLTKTICLSLLLAGLIGPALADNARLRNRKPPDRVVKHYQRQLGAALLPVMIDIPPGCFQMGSPESEAGRSDNELPHRVCMSGFKLGKYEITVAEFRKFIEASHYVTDAERNRGQEGCWSYQSGGEFYWDWRPGTHWAKPINGEALAVSAPVSCVSFEDVLAYIAWLNKETGLRFRLPTEAEWEYAARAGTTTARYWGNNIRAACSYANVADDSPSPLGRWPVRHRCQDGYFFAAPVGSLRANRFGVYDMLGNVWEWTCSSYQEFYSGGEQTCFAGQPQFDTLIAIRGGAWNADAARIRAAHRNWGAAWSRQANLGFRLVQEPMASKKPLATGK